MSKNIESNIFSAESPELLFKKYIKAGIEEGLSKVKRRFEKPKDSKDNFPFHNKEHSSDVPRRARKIILAAYGVTEETIDTLSPAQRRAVELTELGGAWHDTIQNYIAEEQVFDPDKKTWVSSISTIEWDETLNSWKINGQPWTALREGKEFRIFRKRFIGKNEAMSGEETVEFMQNANKQENQEIFSETERKAVKTAIIKGTTPDFNPKLGTVFQKGLEELEPGTMESDIATAIGMGDLGTAGMEKPEAFLSEGDALFREENLDILNNVNNPTLPENVKEAYRKRMLGWTKFQPVFALGRKLKHESECERFIGEGAKERVKELFNNLDNSIEAAKIRTTTREKMTFDELAQDMGYKF